MVSACLFMGSSQNEASDGQRGRCSCLNSKYVKVEKLQALGAASKRGLKSDNLNGHVLR